MWALSFNFWTHLVAVVLKKRMNDCEVIGPDCIEPIDSGWDTISYNVYLSISSHEAQQIKYVILLCTEGEVQYGKRVEVNLRDPYIGQAHSMYFPCPIVWLDKTMLTASFHNPTVTEEFNLRIGIYSTTNFHDLFRDESENLENENIWTKHHDLRPVRFEVDND